MAEDQNEQSHANDNGFAAAHNMDQQSEGGRAGQDQADDRKRKRFDDHKGRFGSRGKRRNTSRKELEREKYDRRRQVEEEQQKQSVADPAKPSVLPAGFAKEEIEAEDRRPKRKVAVLIGYSGTGYKGMQISPTEKTIEGELFTAFVKAGAISKANANDPKKSSLVRCARTDKGVHAAGNMISLKLIVEDEDIVEKINTELPAQIRVWGLERTVGSFSCYQSCDSRWYEYLLPTHALLPPHPTSFLGTKISEISKEVGDEFSLAKRQESVQGFWEKVEREQIKPLLEALDPEVREVLEKSLYPTWDGSADAQVLHEDDRFVRSIADINDAPAKKQQKGKKNKKEAGEDEQEPEEPDVKPEADAPAPVADARMSPEHWESLQTATKQIKQIYDTARRSYRVTPDRIDALQGALSTYVGTRNYWNYTIQKTFNDPSSKRNIKSFVVNPEPILINGTEWLSLKVHGQSFMMHQIRKMVGMAALLIRCGADAPVRITESFGSDRWSVPKVPGLGLLLERPVFSSYNTTIATKYEKPALDFDKFNDKIEAFKHEFIYDKIYDEEAKENTFHQFFNHIDNFAQSSFLYLTSKGFEATKTTIRLNREEPAEVTAQPGNADTKSADASATQTTETTDAVTSTAAVADDVPEKEGEESKDDVAA